MSQNILGKTNIVKEAILNITTDENMIINRIGKIKKAMITKKKKKSKKDNFQQAQIIKTFTYSVIV